MTKTRRTSNSFGLRCIHTPFTPTILFSRSMVNSEVSIFASGASGDDRLSVARTLASSSGIENGFTT